LQVLIDPARHLLLTGALGFEEGLFMAFREFETAAISRRSLLRGGAYLAASGALASVPWGRAALAHDVSDAWPNVAVAANSYVSSGKVPNVLACFGWREDDPHTVGGGTIAFGNDTPAGLDALYRIYSMTKPVTGMATMMCIEDGLIGLDQPVAEILPAFADMQVLKDRNGALEDTVPVNRPITIRHLLTHTAGIGYDIISKGPLLQAYRDNGLNGGQVSRFPIPGFPQIESAPGLAEWTDRLAKLPLITQPGTEWSYSYSIDVLGRVIEAVSGLSFDEFLQQRIFDPCGMDSTYFAVPESELGRLTDNYGIAGGMTLPLDTGRNSIFAEKPPVFWGGSGLVCSPRDYDRFLKMLLGYGQIDGKRVMAEQTVRTGISNLLPADVDTSHAWLAGQGFGAGGRSVNGSYGWGGAAGTLASVDFKFGLRSTLFTQYMPSDAFPMRDEFLGALAKDLARYGA
jgi:CubicO group peptidase (beta-lactamase class C family)